MPVLPALHALDFLSGCSSLSNGSPEVFPSLKHGRPAVILAPMQGVTDAPMRALQSERGGFSLCVTEFLRVTEHVLPERVFHTRVPELLNQDHARRATMPISVQLLGGDAELLAATARVAVEAGARAIDINFGCPAPTVNRHDGGAMLLRYPRRIREIVSAIRQAVPAAIPVSAKLRLGWDSLDPIHENAEMAAQGGASWLTIHARTRMQGYQPPAFWGSIGEVNRRLPLPIVANGDLWTIEDFRRCRDETGCEHYMLGRSALGDPWLQYRVRRELGIATPRESALAMGEVDKPLIEWLPLLRRFAELSFETSDEMPGRAANSRYTAGRLKQWLRIAADRRGASWLELIKLERTTEAVMERLTEAAEMELAAAQVPL